MSLPDRTPKEIRDAISPTATPVRGDVAHLSKSDNESEGVLTEDISRLQSALNNYSASLTYGIGDFVLESEITYRNIIAVTTPEAFDVTKWEVITSQGSITPTLAASITPTDFVDAFALYVSGKYAYVVASDSDSLSIIDISEPTNPTRVGLLIDNINLDGIRGIHVAGKFAYVASETADTFSIIDISEPTNPTLVGVITDSTNLNTATDVYVSGKFAYVLARGAPNSFVVIDISDPTNPVIVGVVVNSGGTLNDPRKVYVQGKFAYVASGNGDAITIIDISDPTDPIVTDFLADPIDTDGARSIYVSGRYAYVASFETGSLAVFDISDPTNIIRVGLLIDANIAAAFGVYVSGKFAYVTSGALNSLSIIDISDPTNPTFVTTFVNASLDGAKDPYVSGKFAYVASSTADSFSVIDISGIDAPSASIGNVEAGYLSVTDNAVIANNLYSGGLNVGISGIHSDGQISANDDVTVTPTNPTLAGFIFDNINLEEAEAVYVSGKFAYVASSTANSLTVIDISDPTTPTFVGSLIDPVNLNGAKDVYVSGKFAYVASQTAETLSVIDISDPKTPILAGVFKDGTKLNGPSHLYVSGKFAYVASINGDSLTVIDISDPTNPTFTGIVSDAVIMNGSFDVYVSGKFAYVIAITANTLAVIDISDPTNPTIVGSLMDGTNLNVPRAIYVSGKFAYVASQIGNSLSIFDISDPTSPTFTGIVSDAINLNAPFDVYVSGKFAYVAAHDGDSLAVVDISDPTNPTFVASLVDTTNLDSAHGVYVSGKFAYVASEIADTLSVIDITGIDAPSASIGNVEAGYLSVTDNAVIANNLYSGGLNVGISGIHSDGQISANDDVTVTHNTPTFAGSVTNVTDLDGLFGVYVVGKYAYVTAQNNNSMSVVDISEPTNPVIVGTTTPNTARMEVPREVFVVGNFAYVAGNTSDRLAVVDISDPTNPVIVNTDSIILDGAFGVYVSGNFAYVTSSTADTLSIIDVSNPITPILTSTVTGLDGARNVYVQGNYAYVTNVAAAANSLSIIDISDPTNGTIVGTFTDANMIRPRGLHVSGRYAYVGGSDTPNTFVIIDISDPTNPVLAGFVTDANFNNLIDLRVSGNFAYVSTNAGRLIIVDISDPANPVVIQSIISSSFTFARSLYVSGNHVYQAFNADDSLSVINISGILSPSANIGNVEAGYLSVTDNAVIANDLYAGTINARTGALNGAQISALGNTTFEIFTQSDLPDPGAGAITSFGKLGGTLSGYTDAELITLSGGTGTGATATAVITGGEIQSVTLTGGGSGYLIHDVLTITGDTSTTATATIIVNTTDGAITLETGAYIFMQNMLLFNRLIIANNATVDLRSPSGSVVAVTYVGTTGTTFMTALNTGSSITFTNIQFFLSGVDITFIDSNAANTRVNDSQILLVGTGDKKLGTINNTNGGIAMRDSLLFGNTEGFTITAINNIQADGVFIFSQTTGGGTDTMYDIASLSDNVNFRNCGNRLLSTETLFDFDTSIVAPSRISIISCRSNDGTFYDPTGLDQTSILVTASDNDSPDSMTIGGWFINGNGNVTDIVTAGVFVPFNLDTAIAYAENERFTLSDATTGELTFDGLKEATVSITGSLDLITGDAAAKTYNFKGQIDRGEIDTAAVDAAGTGYTDNDSVTLTGQTSGATNATATLSVTAGAITAINIVFGGSGYTNSETVNVIGGTGSGGTGTATILGFVDLDTPIIFPIQVGNATVPKTFTQEVIMNTDGKLRFEVAGIGTTVDITISGTINLRSA